MNTRAGRRSKVQQLLEEETKLRVPTAEASKAGEGMMVRDCFRTVDRERQLSRIRRVKRQVMKAGLWRRVEILDRAVLRVVQHILEKGDEHLVSKISRSAIVNMMLRSATQRIVALLASVGRSLYTFRARALLEGARIAEERIRVYRENGVFAWAPWGEKWLRETETMLFLGFTSVAASGVWRG